MSSILLFERRTFAKWASALPLLSYFAAQGALEKLQAAVGKKGGDNIYPRIAPGGTNIPHHHDNAEEIYYVLNGQGDMVAGGGADGTEGRYPAKAGDAYFFRLNTTVGFYSGTRAGEEHAHVLAVRSSYPSQTRAARGAPE